MGWVEERWAARGWGGGEGEGIMEPTEAAAQKGARRENEKAAPSLIPPSVPLFSFGHSCSGRWDIHNFSLCVWLPWSLARGWEK